MTFTAAETKAADDAFRIHAKGGCGDDCGFCYDLQLAGEPKYEREYKRIADIKAQRRSGSQTLVTAEKAGPTRRQKRKENKSKFRRR